MPLNLEGLDFNAFERRPEGFDSLEATLDQATQVNPATHAENLRLAGQSGLPVQAVEGDPVAVRSRLNLQGIDWDGMAQRSPGTAQFLGNYDNAVVAQNDIPLLEQMESLVSGAARTFQGLGRSIALGFEQQLLGAALSGADTMGSEIDNLIPASALPPGVSPLVAQQMSRQFAANLGIGSDEDLRGAKDEAVGAFIADIEAVQQQREDITPEDLNLLQQGVRAGIESLTIQVPGLIASILTRSSAPMLGIMGLQARSTAYADARAGGLSPDAAATYANIDATIEFGTELLPATSLMRVLGVDDVADALVDTVGGKVKNRLLKEIGRFAVQEMGTEQIATLGQSVNAWAFELDEQLENASSALEVADIMLERAAVTAIATAVAGGGQIAAVTAVGKTIEAMQASTAEEQQRSAEEQATIDEVARLAEQSELKKVSPEAFSQFLAQNAAPGKDQVFIDGAQLALYLREQGPAAQDDPALILLGERVQEAQALGTDVVVSTADFATVIAGTPHFEALREHMTMSTESVAPFRAAEVQRQTQDFIADLMREAQENVSEYAEAQEIYETVKNQLVDSGAYSPANAGVMAQIVPAWFTRFARQQGISIQEAYERSGLQIVGPQTGERQRLEGELAVLEQAKKAGYEGDILREAQEWQAGVRKFGPQGMTRAARLARARELGVDTSTKWYHSTDENFTEFQTGVKTSNTILGSEVETTRHAVFLSDSRKFAETFKPSGKVMELYVIPGATLELDTSRGRDFVLDFADALMEYGMREEALAVKSGHMQGWQLFDGVIGERFAAFLKEKSYDSVSFLESTEDGDTSADGRTLAMLDPTAIRSINATFDPDYTYNGDLLAQLQITDQLETETGEVVEVSMTAEQALAEVDDRIDGLKQLIRCLR